MKQSPYKTGFTLVELTLALAFISVLLVTIAFVTTQITASFAKGTTMKAINSLGIHVTDDLVRSIHSAPPTSLENICSYRFQPNTPGMKACIDNRAWRMHYISYEEEVEINGQNDGVRKQVHGAFCTGRYSYVWHTGYTLEGEDNIRHYQFPRYGNNNQRPRATILRRSNQQAIFPFFRLARVIDSKHSICSSRLDENYNQKPSEDRGDTYVLDDTAGVEHIGSNATELISDAEEAIALYDFRLFQPAYHSNTRQFFHSGTFILGTIGGSINVNAESELCRGPDKSYRIGSDQISCAINKFNFAARAIGETYVHEQYQNIPR